MTIQRIHPEDLEVFTLETTPRRSYSSGSWGVSGSLFVFPRRSHSDKEPRPLAAFSASWFQDTDLSTLVDAARKDAFESGSNNTAINGYLSAVNSLPTSARKQHKVEVIRFTPSVDLDKDTQRKACVINTLLPFYRSAMPSAHWNYTNFNSLNFFTGSGIPTGSVLLYPQIVSSPPSIAGDYIFGGAFSFDFWVNPRYTADTATSGFKAGTIMHLSSTYAVSVVSGSGRDENNKPNGFRVLLQLSASAGIAPSRINTSSLPALAFLSDDNSLQRNHWHHVTVRWGTNSYNNGTGSFVIDGVNKGLFAVPSSSVTPLDYSPADNPTVLCVGNFYEGDNTGANIQALFFNKAVSRREGLVQLDPTDPADTPASYSFAHPLNAEIHDLKLYNKYLSNTEVASLRTGGPENLDNLLFYLPPFFTRESPGRQRWNGFGGVLISPFLERSGSTSHPFEVDMSFDVGGHYINLENHVRDFARGRYPRLWELSGSALQGTVSTALSADQYLYATGSVRRRALTVLPCDNGTFYPRFNLLSDLDTSAFVTDLGRQELGSVSLRDMYPTSSIYTGMLSDISGSIMRALMGNASGSLGRVPTILQRTRDNTSNQVVFFDISNLFYGNKIDPGTLVLVDPAVSGSGGKVKVTLKDDGEGNLYRADSTGSLATWNSVGNVFYNEGIIVLKSPHLRFFGETEWNMTFRGQQNLHVLHIDCAAMPGMQTSSSNPSYVPVSASNNANDTDKKFVYITDVLIHDDNLNVIARTRLAQPVVKRTSDRLTFKTKIDF